MNLIFVVWWKKNQFVKGGPKKEKANNDFQADRPLKSVVMPLRSDTKNSSLKLGIIVDFRFLVIISRGYLGKASAFGLNKEADSEVDPESLI